MTERPHPGMALATVAFSASFTMMLGANLQSSGQTKVTLCHRPPGNPSHAHTISVGSSAVPAHLNHGDHLGACTASPSR